MTNEQLQAIIDGAPEGATHVDTGNYIKSDPKTYVFSDWDDVNKTWCAYYEPSNRIRSISDLREILAVREAAEAIGGCEQEYKDYADKLERGEV